MGILLLIHFEFEKKISSGVLERFLYSLTFELPSLSVSMTGQLKYNAEGRVFVGPKNETC